MRYAIIKKRNSGWTLAGNEEYETKGAARKEVKRRGGFVYRLTHGEYSAPDYRVVAAGGRLYMAAKRRTG